MKLCRLCLTKNKVSHNLYEDNANNISSLALIVSKWFQIAPNDVVSIVICAHCWKNTLNFHIFCSKVVKAQREGFKDSTFVKRYSHDDDATSPTTSGVENYDDAILTDAALEYQPKFDAFNLKECKVELVAVNGEQSNYKSQRDHMIEHIKKIHKSSNGYSTMDRSLNDGLNLQKGLKTNTSEDQQMLKKYARHSFVTRHKLQSYCKKEDKVFGCDTCQKKFLTKSVLKRHIIRSHVSEVCDYCGKQFKCKYYLNVHRNEAHMGVEITRLQCHVCGVWMRTSNLSKHVKTHNVNLKIERSICPICSKELKNKIVLKRHIKIVHGSREHQCTICGKKFGIPLSLKEHMAVHTGEDLYKCRYCAKTFKSNANMHAHRKKAHFKEWEEDRGKRLIDGRYQ